VCEIVKYNVGDILVHNKTVLTVITAEPEGCLLHDNIHEDTEFYKLSDIASWSITYNYIHYAVVEV
jgi:hypothetical protein